MGTMSIMGRSGDTKVIWDRNNNVEVETARRTFQRLRNERFLAFSVTKTGDRGTQIDAFDPDAESLIMVPPMAGGAS